MKLRELCEICDVPRRAVQGYEKLGLVKPAGKNEQGHLLYDEYARHRIDEIRLLQKMGFSLTEICQLIDLEPEQKKQLINRQIEVLREEEIRIEQTIRQALSMYYGL